MVCVSQSRSGGHTGDSVISASTHLVFHTNGSNERVRITSDGVFKITGKTSTIETAGLTHHTNNNLYIRGGTTGAVLQSVDGNEAWIVQNDYISGSTAGSERLRINNAGITTFYKVPELDTTPTSGHDSTAGTFGFSVPELPPVSLEICIINAALPSVI